MQTRPIAVAVLASLVCASCARQFPPPPAAEGLRSRWLEHVAAAKLGPKAAKLRSQRWQGVRVTFTSSKAPGMRREWLVLLPERGRPRPEALGEIYGALVVDPDDRSGLGNPKCERLAHRVAEEMLRWSNEGRHLSEDPWLGNITPLLFGESLEAVRTRWRLGQLMAEQLGAVHEHVFQLNVETGERDDYIPMEGAILVDSDGAVLWHGVTSAITRSF